MIATGNLMAVLNIYTVLFLILQIYLPRIHMHALHDPPISVRARLALLQLPRATALIMYHWINNTICHFRLRCVASCATQAAVAVTRLRRGALVNNSASQCPQRPHTYDRYHVTVPAVLGTDIEQRPRDMV